MDNNIKENNQVSSPDDRDTSRETRPQGNSNDEQPSVVFAVTSLPNTESHVYIPADVPPDSLRQRNTRDVISPTAEQYTIVTKHKLLNQEEFDKQYHGGHRPTKSMQEMASDFKDSFECSGRSIKKKVSRMFPIFQLPKYYDMPSDLISDLIAGLTVGIMHIPQGMAYASLASLPAEYGLYTSLFPVILYALLGTSRHTSPGTYAVVCLMIGGAVESYNCEEAGSSTSDSSFHSQSNATWNHTTSGGTGNDDNIMACKVSVAVTVTAVGGFFQLLLGVLHLGFINIYMSEPLSRGFTTGAAVHVFTSQVKGLFGVPLQSFYGPWKLIYVYNDFFSQIHKTNLAALILSVICIIVIYCTKEYVNPLVKKITKNKGFIPIDFIMIIVGTIASSYLSFEDKYDINVVGYIPTGIPAPKSPDRTIVPNIIGDAIGVAIVSYASSMSLTQLFAKKHNYEYDSNQELIAHGVTNVVCSNLNCFMMSMSLSRSVVCENVGCKSPVTQLISSSVLFVVILFVASYFEQLPRCILAAIIVVALKGMFKQLLDLKRYWKRNKVDFSVWLVTFTSVVLLDVALGLVVGVIYALLTVVGTTQRPYCTLEGEIDHTAIYKDIEVFTEARSIPGIKIFRFDGSIYFASKQYFIDSLYEKTGCNARRIKQQQLKYQRLKGDSAKSHCDFDEVYTVDVDSGGKCGVGPKSKIHHIILDSTTIAYLDDSGVQAITQVCSEYRDIGVTVFLAGCKAGVRDMLEKGDFHTTFNKEIMFPTIHDAVIAALSGVAREEVAADV